MATGYRITGLPPYIGEQIKNSDLVPVVYAAPDGVTFTTFHAHAYQVKNYIIGTITNQDLFENSTVNFRDITGEDIRGTSSVTSPSAVFTKVSATSARFDNLFASNLNINSVSAPALSATTLSAISATFNGYPAVTKFIATINHIGSPTATLYNITHPFPDRHVIVQVHQLQPDMSESVYSIVSITNSPHTSKINLTDSQNHTYEVVIMG